jgi:hypothetical protein
MKGRAFAAAVAWPFDTKETVHLAVDTMVAVGTVGATFASVIQIRRGRLDRQAERRREVLDRIYRPLWEELDGWNHATLFIADEAKLEWGIWPALSDKWPTEGERVPAALQETLTALCRDAHDVATKLSFARAEVKQAAEAWIAQAMNDPGRRESVYFPVFAGNHSLGSLDLLWLWLRDEDLAMALDEKARKWGAPVELATTWSGKRIERNLADNLIRHIATVLDAHSSSVQLKHAYQRILETLPAARDQIRSEMRIGV